MEKGMNAIQAQKIAEGIMGFIPYNINIMDSQGYIIASGNKERLNTMHMGAVYALSTLKPHIIEKDTKTERKGVNLPIIHKEQAVGVIGISGEPDEVMPIAQIVQFTAKLMMENEEYNALALMRDVQKRDFLLEWANYDSAKYSSAFIQRGKALDIDIRNAYIAVLFDRKNGHDAPGEMQLRQSLKLNHTEYVIWYRRNDVLLALREKKDLWGHVQNILSKNLDLSKAYIGEKQTTLHRSITRARQTRFVTPHLYPEKTMISYEESSMDQCLLTSVAGSNIAVLQEYLREKDLSGELSTTIYAYMNNSHDISKICNILHIHRNTLNYRLGRIEEICGKNPRNARELLELYYAVLLNRMDH